LLPKCAAAFVYAFANGSHLIERFEPDGSFSQSEPLAGVRTTGWRGDRSPTRSRKE